jgi:adenylate cyclase class 2
MKTEIEVKFLNVNFDRLRTKLRSVGAVCEQPMRLMRRVIIEPPELARRDAFVRVRDEGDKITLTYKQFDDHEAMSGVKEIELTVSSFDAMVAIFEQLGISYRSYQESKRETWRFGDVEIVLDEWPWLNPYIEIEGIHEDHVKKTAALLGFNWNDAVFGSVTAAYQKQYPKGQAHQLITISKVTFDAPLPVIISGEGE